MSRSLDRAQLDPRRAQPDADHPHAAGVALASLLGWFVARTALAPVRRLTRPCSASRRRGPRPADRRAPPATSSAARAPPSTRCSVCSTTTIQKLDESARGSGGSSRTHRTSCAPRSTSIRTNIEMLERARADPGRRAHQLIADVVAAARRDVGADQRAHRARPRRGAAAAPRGCTARILVTEEAIRRTRATLRRLVRAQPGPTTAVNGAPATPRPGRRTTCSTTP